MMVYREGGVAVKNVKTAAILCGLDSASIIDNGKTSLSCHLQNGNSAHLMGMM